MLTPVSLEFTAMLSTTALGFTLWHFWHYDRMRCLVPTRKDAFRSIMCYAILFAEMCLVVHAWIGVYILYDVYYLPFRGVVMPVPSTLWPDTYRTKWRVATYLVATGWACMMSVHLEEFLYWGYLIASIRYPSGPQIPWFRSMFFKVWLGATIACAALIFGATSIEQSSLEIQRAYTFLVGGCISAFLAVASTALCFSVPKFILTIKSHGATSEVLSRLALFEELNRIRTVLRWLFAACAITLGADAFTSNQRVHRTPWLSDLLFAITAMSIFATLLISVMVLLPRNMSSESQPGANAGHTMREFHVRPESHMPPRAFVRPGPRARDGVARRAPSPSRQGFHELSQPQDAPKGFIQPGPRGRHGAGPKDISMGTHPSNSSFSDEEYDKASSPGHNETSPHLQANAPPLPLGITTTISAHPAAAEDGANSSYQILGERLNLQPDAMRTLVDTLSQHRSSHSNTIDHSRSNLTSGAHAHAHAHAHGAVPFALPPGAEAHEMPVLTRLPGAPLPRPYGYGNGASAPAPSVRVHPPTISEGDEGARKASGSGSGSSDNDTDSVDSLPYATPQGTMQRSYPQPQPSQPHAQRPRHPYAARDESDMGGARQREARALREFLDQSPPGSGGAAARGRTGAGQGQGQGQSEGGRGRVRWSEVEER